MGGAADITILNTDPSEEKGIDVHLREENLQEQANNARELFIAIQDELDHKEEDIRQGLSFLDMKNDTLLSYMIDVCNIILLKVRGDTIQGHKSVERCVEYRVILEKIKAIDRKLAYQLNKLITLPEEAEEESQGIDVNNLDLELEDVGADSEDQSSKRDDRNSGSSSDDDSGGSLSCDEDQESDETGEDQESKEESARRISKTSKKSAELYKPPKLRSVAYTEEADYKRGDRGRRKNYDEFYQDEEPTEFVEGAKHSVDINRIRFEEEHYTRLPDENPKKAKRKMKTKEYRRKGKTSKKFKKR